MEMLTQGEWCALAGTVYGMAAFICYGLFFAFWQNTFSAIASEDYPYDMAFSAVTALLWPVAIPSHVIACALRGRKIFNGFKIR